MKASVSKVFRVFETLNIYSSFEKCEELATKECWQEYRQPVAWEHRYPFMSVQVVVPLNMPVRVSSNRHFCENKWKTMTRQILVAVSGGTNPHQATTDAGGQPNAQPMKCPTNRPILNKWSCQTVIYVDSSGSQQSPAVNIYGCAQKEHKYVHMGMHVDNNICNC